MTSGPRPQSANGNSRQHKKHVPNHTHHAPPPAHEDIESVVRSVDDFNLQENDEAAVRTDKILFAVTILLTAAIVVLLVTWATS